MNGVGERRPRQQEEAEERHPERVVRAVEHVAEQPREDERQARRDECEEDDEAAHGYSLPMQFGDLPLEFLDLALEAVEPALRAGGPACAMGAGATRPRRRRRRLVLQVLAQPVRVAVLLLPGPARVARDELALDQARRASPRARRRGTSTAARPAARSSPGVCGPRSISTASSACSSTLSPGVSSSRWRYFAARAPLAKRVQRRRAEPVQRVADRRLVVGDDGVAVRRLVARCAQRVEAQRIDVRRRALLLDQAPEHPDLDGIQIHVADSRESPAAAAALPRRRRPAPASAARGPRAARISSCVIAQLRYHLRSAGTTCHGACVGVAALERVGVGGHVVVPQRAVLEVARVVLPALGRVLEAGEQPLALLLGRDVQEALDDRSCRRR